LLAARSQSPICARLDLLDIGCERLTERVQVVLFTHRASAQKSIADFVTTNLWATK
jgi:hypothetical protein